MNGGRYTRNDMISSREGMKRAAVTAYAILVVTINSTNSIILHPGELRILIIVIKCGNGKDGGISATAESCSICSGTGPWTSVSNPPMRKVGIGWRSTRGTRVRKMSRRRSVEIAQAARCRNAAWADMKCIIVNALGAANPAAIGAPTREDNVTLTVCEIMYGAAGCGV